MSAVATRAECKPLRPAAVTTPSEAAVLRANHRWKVLGIGVAANACFSATFSGIPATAVFLRSGYHLSNGELGLALGLLGLGVALSELPWGLLTDRWGDRRVLLTGLGATAVWLLVMAALVVPSPAHIPRIALLAAALLVTGLLGGSVNGSSGRAIMAWFGEGERGFAMSIRQTAVPLGGGLGALVLPSLASAHGFTAVFGLLAAASAVSTSLAWRWLHQPPAHDDARSSSAAKPAGPAPLQPGRLAHRDSHWPALLSAGGGAHLCFRVPA
ncbi:MFS transporter [Mesorhizobium sp. M0085]|uniref:MFS transporter n=1 Tax=Mesorhizobium sp. M0085 TaxID=2956872 RepID=UPI00333C5C6D